MVCCLITTLECTVFFLSSSGKSKLALPFFSGTLKPVLQFPFVSGGREGVENETNVIRFASFCELLRRPLLSNKGVQTVYDICLWAWLGHSLHNGLAQNCTKYFRIMGHCNQYSKTVAVTRCCAIHYLILSGGTFICRLLFARALCAPDFSNINFLTLSTDCMFLFSG